VCVPVCACLCALWLVWVLWCAVWWLCVPMVAGFALCGAVAVCVVRFRGVQLMLRCGAVCVLCINKIKHLQQILNVFDYMGIILGLSADYIIYYLSPPLGDNRDNAVVFFRPKKRDSPRFGRTPPQKFSHPYFL